MHHLNIIAFYFDYDKTIFENLESEGANYLNIEKIIFKSFLSKHITNQNFVLIYL